MPNEYLTDKLRGFFDNKGDLMRLNNDNGPDWPHIDIEKMFKNKNIKLKEVEVKIY